MQDKKPETRPDIPEEEFDKVWKPKPYTDVGFGAFGFGITLSIPEPPKKPEDEPLQ